MTYDSLPKYCLEMSLPWHRYPKFSLYFLSFSMHINLLLISNKGWKIKLGGEVARCKSQILKEINYYS